MNGVGGGTGRSITGTFVSFILAGRTKSVLMGAAGNVTYGPRISPPRNVGPLGRLPLFGACSLIGTNTSGRGGYSAFFTRWCVYRGTTSAGSNKNGFLSVAFACLEGDLLCAYPSLTSKGTKERLLFWESGSFLCLEDFM